MDGKPKGRFVLRYGYDSQRYSEHCPSVKRVDRKIGDSWEPLNRQRVAPCSMAMPACRSVESDLPAAALNTHGREVVTASAAEPQTGERHNRTKKTWLKGKSGVGRKE